MLSSLVRWPVAIHTLLFLSLMSPVTSQQYQGDVIPNSLPTVLGAKLAYFKMPNPNGAGNQSLTLTNYMSTSSSGGKVDGPNVKRAIIVIHGLQRDPQNYIQAMLSARGVVTNPAVNADSVAICAPYFPSGDDKNVGYPWVTGLAAGRGSNTSQLVWKGSNWADGANNQYPWYSTTMSSYAAIDTLIKYFNDPSIFPNMQQIVVAGHSLGSQMIHRYAAVGDVLSLRVPLTYYVANPNSYLWFTTTRPLDTSSCATYDDWRAGLNAYTSSNSYGTSIVASGRDAVLARYNSRQIAYARGTQDFGDDSSDCAPFTTGANRAERFFNFLKAFPPTCNVGGTCDTVDYVNAGHDATAMFTSAAGSARLFLDNFDGAAMSPDFGCPRLQAGDDPYPDPNGGCAAGNNSTNSTTTGPKTYAGNMTYVGCYSDQSPASLPTMIYQSTDNTVEKCTTACDAAGYTIAGMEWGQQCFCGNQLTSKAVQTVDIGCTMACPGNSSEICGDNNRLSLYSNGPPSVLSNPGFPNTVGPFNFLGCYTDTTSARSLTGKATSGSSINLETCGTFCSGFSYFGVEYGDECYCGNTLSSASTSVALTDCSMLCAANQTEFCGAGNRLTMYMNNQTVSSSSSSVVLSTTISASSTATVAAPTNTPLSCPGSNGQTYTTSKNSTFLVECSVDHAGYDMGSAGATTLEACIAACDAKTGCLAFSWVSGGSNACYLKSGVGAPNTNTIVWGGKLLSSAGQSSSSSSSTAAPTTLSTVSSQATVVSSSTSSALVAAVTGTVTCPGDNGKTYNAADGAVFLVECGIDHAGGDFQFVYTASYGACFAACDTTKTCVAFSWVPSNTACYMKSAIGYNQLNSGVWGGKMLSSATGVAPTPTASSTKTGTTTAKTSTSTGPVSTDYSCPGSNGQQFTGASGQVFLIECNNDHAGGDLSFQYTNTYAQCIALCDATATCVAFSWVSGGSNACYMKNAIGYDQQSALVWGGKLIKGLPSSTSSAPTPTPTVAAFTCPDSNGTVYQATSGQKYLVQCLPL